ncbi:MAG: MGMT family protein [bacterium]|nr:MGMT family protein [bacterium]
MTRFFERVYQLTKRIPRGKVTTYGQLAILLGKPGAARAVGQVLNKNPFAPKVPCHRVIGTDGNLCGFAKGLRAKEELLKAEGVEVRGWRVDLKNYLYKR